LLDHSRVLLIKCYLNVEVTTNYIKMYICFDLNEYQSKHNVRMV